jgi:saccharopine dehydrogenase-like NADP-dependent oxidoreductase
MRGVYNVNPPAPKYTATWDPAIVLAHFDASATPWRDIPRQKNQSMARQNLDFDKNWSVYCKIHQQFIAKFSDFLFN